MYKQEFVSILLLIFQKCAVGFGKFDSHGFSSHLDPRFLNSDYQFNGLGLFKPHFGSSGIHESNFDEQKKSLNEDNFFIKNGGNGADLTHGNFGIFKGEEDSKDLKGESEAFFNVDGEKKEHVNEKDYNGGHHFGSEEKSEDEKSIKQGHRKGHKIKGFSKSHHNDESGKTEEYYDEAHDEADKEQYEGKSGGFGESGSSSFKGGHLDKESKNEEVKKDTHFDKGIDSKQVSKDEQHFGENEFGGSEKRFGEQKLLGDSGLSEYSGSSKFWKHHPASGYY